MQHGADHKQKKSPFISDGTPGKIKERVLLSDPLSFCLRDSAFGLAPSAPAAYTGLVPGFLRDSPEFLLRGSFPVMKLRIMMNISPGF